MFFGKGVSSVNVALAGFGGDSCSYGDLLCTLVEGWEAALLMASLTSAT